MSGNGTFWNDFSPLRWWWSLLILLLFGRGWLFVLLRDRQSRS